MAGIVRANEISGATLFVNAVRVSDGFFYNTNSQVFEDYVLANDADYKINLTEVGTKGFYKTAFPTIAAGTYLILIYMLNVSDPRGGYTVVWDGTSEVSFSAADIWSYATRTLTQTAAQVAAIVSGTDVTVKRGDTWTISFTGLGSIANRTKLWFSVKGSDGDADTESLVQIEESTGLVYLSGAPAATAADGSLVVDDQAAGDITITLKPAATAVLEALEGLSYDVQVLTSAGAISTKTEGAFTITGDVTRATS
jgi:hypothetical protein